MLPAKIKRFPQGMIMISLITTALFAVSSIAIAQNNIPRAIVTEPVKDAGEITSDKKLIEYFIITNEGNTPLHITNVNAACGCTCTRYDTIIAPRKTGKVYAVTDISGFTGLVSKDIYVFTNDPANPVILLTTKASVIKTHPIAYF